MIDEDAVEKALNYLRDSSEDYARSKGRARALAFRLKVTESEEFLSASGAEKMSVEHKKALAKASKAYKDLVDEYESAEIESLTIEAYREAAAMKVSFYQSSVKARTMGVM